MHQLYDSRAKTIPSNHRIVGVELVVPGSDIPGYSCTPDQWEKARRMELPNYDWAAYRKAIKDHLFDHPELAHKTEMQAQRDEWNKILSDLEPFHQ